MITYTTQLFSLLKTAIYTSSKEFNLSFKRITLSLDTMQNEEI